MEKKEGSRERESSGSPPPSHFKKVDKQSEEKQKVCHGHKGQKETMLCLQHDRFEKMRSKIQSDSLIIAYLQEHNTLSIRYAWHSEHFKYDNSSLYVY